MFCPNCGKPNLEDSRFCEECGAALVGNAAPAQPQYSEATATDSAPTNQFDIALPKINFTKIKTIFKKTWFLLIPVLVIAILVSALYLVGSSMASPERVAKQYFKALAAGDYKEMYQHLSLPNNELINEDTFVAYMTAYAEDQGEAFADVKRFTIEDLSAPKNDSNYGNGYTSDSTTDTNPELKKYRISVVDKLTGYIDTMELTLIRQDAKRWLFFDTYKVSSADYIVQDIQFSIPVQGTIAVDGVALTAEPQKTDDGYVYEVETLFSGTHKITVTTDLFETYETEVDLHGNNPEYDFAGSDFMQLKTELAATVQNQAIDAFKTLYKNALEQKAYDAAIVTTMPDSIDLEYCYDSIKDRMEPNNDGTGLKTLTLTASADGEDIDYCHFDYDGNIEISFYVEFDYTYTYTYYDGWVDPVLTDGEGSGSRSVRFVYTYAEGQWLLSGMENYTFSLYY